MPPTIAWLLSLMLVMPAASRAAEGYVCPDRPEVLVAEGGEKAADAICAAADKALAFLARYDLHPQRPIMVQVVEKHIDNRGYPAFGRYESGPDRIELMSYPAILAATENPTMYGEPFDRVHYSGLIAHEVAHAVIYPYIKKKQAAMASQEYLAHATQLAVLPEARRKAILEAMDVGPWVEGDEISHIYMALHPGRFAAKSYLHLTTMADPDAFVQTLLNTNWRYIHVPGESSR